MAASASSPQVPQEKYDVFISFRGPDVRCGFLSHLKKELRRKQIYFYVDERLERGDEISTSLMDAIEGSMISLVIFSKDYASSKWCLEELVKIMECKEGNGQIVIPVFYNVDPSDVRHQKGSYAVAFAQHEQKFKVNIGKLEIWTAYVLKIWRSVFNKIASTQDEQEHNLNMEKLQIWRCTLKKAANLSGYHYPSNFQDEFELIDGIVKVILKKFKGRDTVERKGFVGFEQSFTCVESLMEIESQEVLFFGIWGTGGIGKTTLARAIFDEFSAHFESCCFMENVRAESITCNGLSNLHQKLVFELLKQENLNMNDALMPRFYKRILLQKKLLIVLDDVDTSMQLKDLVEGLLGYGTGSKVIVTSRDRHVLISGGIRHEHIHEVRELNFKESLELFSLNAFNQSHPEKEFEELSHMTVAYAKGIPLALKVLGSHFCSRDKIYWESELSKLKKCPKREIQNVLTVSYDGLDDVEKGIFLDIAFFFVGKQKDEVTMVLDASDLKVASGIVNLVNKALIKIVDSGIIQMHDLIQEMAKQIVHEESIKHPEGRSRLNNPKEIYDLLKNNIGTNKIEGLMFDVSQIKDLQLHFDTFTKMTKLRILKFYCSYHYNRSNIELPFGLKSFSNELRYLYWLKYPLESLPLGFCPENLVELDMKRSKLKKLWDGTQDLVNLKTLNLSESEQLMELPDFSMAHKLKKVNLRWCISLQNVHPVLSVRSLVELDLYHCIKLESLESQTHLESLSVLNFSGCDNLEKFSLSPEKMTILDLQNGIKIFHLPNGRFTELRELRLFGQRLESISINELCGSIYLEEFQIRGFRYVIDKMDLHNLFDALRCLRTLDLEGCSKLSGIPENIGALTRLEYLSLVETSVESLPASIELLSSLTRIDLRKCRKLRSILGLPPLIKCLDARECASLETLISSTLAPVEQKPLHMRCFEFNNCVKLDEPSLSFIRELTYFSLCSDCMYDKYEYRSACYPGSRVPPQIPYKQTTEASNAVEFTCNLHRLRRFIFCCVLSQFTTMTEATLSINCDRIDGVYYKFESYYPKVYNVASLNSDHVFLWRSHYSNFARTGDHGKFVFKFNFIEHPSDWVACYRPDLIKACGVCPIYASESESEPEPELKSKLVWVSKSEVREESWMRELGAGYE